MPLCVFTALLLILGVILQVVAGAALGWYPSRIGGPAYWLDDHLYQPVLGLLSPVPDALAIAGLLFLLALVLSFVGYALGARWALRVGAGRERHFWLILGVQIMLCLWLLVQPYLSSQDIFSYAFYSHIFAWYQDNPYVAVPRDYPFDPLFSAIFWKDQTSNYGPLWTYLSALAPLVAGARVGWTLLVLKAITIGSAVAGTPLLWSTLRRLRPERRVIGTLLYAWNPLLLIESAEAGHNDVVMACLLIASLWFWCRRRRGASLTMLILAALVKYVAIALVPLYLLAWWKESGESPWRVLVRTALVGLGLGIVAFAPVFAGPATFAVVGFGSNSLAYTNSPMELVFREARVFLGESSEVADLPLHYDGHWIGSQPAAILWSFPDEQRGTGILLPAGTSLLVVEAQTGSWVHVYEPKLGRFGFIRANLTHPIPVPTSSVVPGTTAAVLAGVSQDRDAQNANTLVRLLSLAIFLPWYARSLLRLGASADDPLALPREATAVLVVYLLAVQSWFWPWYLIWVLPFAVIVPESGATTVALVMTATTSLLNAQPSISPPPFLDWLYGSRVILIYGVPLVAAAWRAGKLRGVDQWVSGARPCLQTAVDALMNFNFLIGYGARRGWRDVAAFQGRDARRRARPASAERPFARLPSRRRTALQSDPKAMLPGRSLSRPVAESPWPGHATPNPRHATHRAFGIPRKGISRATFVKAATIVAFILACGAQVGSGRAVERQPAVIGWQSAFDAAVRLYSAGDYQGTVDELTAVLAALPGERSVLQLRVAANVALGQYGQTIPDLTALLAQDPEDLDLRFERGVVYSRIQRSDRALADFRAVIAAQPTNPSGYEQAGLVQFERGDLELAGRSLERARNLDPESGQIAQELANVLASENRETAALALYDGAIHLDPSDARAYADRAALLRHLGSNEATIPDLKKVLVLSGDTQQQLWAAHLLAGLTGTGSRIAGESG